MLGQIEPFYFSLNPVIFRRNILFFLKGYSNCALSRECRRRPITQKKPAIQRILNTPMGQIPCITGFLDTNNKRIDRSIVSMLRSMFGGGRWIRTTEGEASRFTVCPLWPLGKSPILNCFSNLKSRQISAF